MVSDTLARAGARGRRPPGRPLRPRRRRPGAFRAGSSASRSFLGGRRTRGLPSPLRSRGDRPLRDPRAAATSSSWPSTRSARPAPTRAPATAWSTPTCACTASAACTSPTARRCPSALGVNPQLTIMALATRLAFGLLGRAVPRPKRSSHVLPDRPRPAVRGRPRLRGARARRAHARPRRGASPRLRWRVFWGVSVGLYLDQGWTQPVWKLCRAESGATGCSTPASRLDWRRAGRRTHAASAAIFATYPLWLWLGMRRGGGA